MKLLIDWDGEIDGAFRRRLERALGELQVEYSDASGVDPDPDAGAPVKLAILASRGSGAARDADLVVLSGPGEFRATTNALRLEASDIEQRTRRWIAFADRLGAKLDRPALAKFAASGDSLEEQRTASLAFPADPLSKDFAPNHSPDVLLERLAAATAHAEAAERTVAALELERFNAAQQAKQTEMQSVRERARIANLEQTIERLTALSESTAYALAAMPEARRAFVADARDHAWQARLAAARAATAAASHPDALVWPKANATYSGETRNRLPHGHGVIVFRNAGGEIARYAGAFEDGQRLGHGIATSDDGHVWTGQWKDGEACGLGLLECPDGSRFEGEVAPDAEGAPREIPGRGHAWPSPAPARPARRPEPHRPVTPILPSPHPAVD
jgi:hypothetical protein